jgi:hypothetical protein
MNGPVRHDAEAIDDGVRKRLSVSTHDECAGGDPREVNGGWSLRGERHGQSKGGGKNGESKHDGFLLQAAVQGSMRQVDFKGSEC